MGPWGILCLFCGFPMPRIYSQCRLQHVIRCYKTNPAERPTTSDDLMDPCGERASQNDLISSQVLLFQPLERKRTWGNTWHENTPYIGRFIVSAMYFEHFHPNVSRLRWPQLSLTFMLGMLESMSGAGHAPIHGATGTQFIIFTANISNILSIRLLNPTLGDHFDLNFGSCPPCFAFSTGRFFILFPRRSNTVSSWMLWHTKMRC